MILGGTGQKKDPLLCSFALKLMQHGLAQRGNMAVELSVGKGDDKSDSCLT